MEKLDAARGGEGARPRSARLRRGHRSLPLALASSRSDEGILEAVRRAGGALSVEGPLWDAQWGECPSALSI